MAGPGLQAELRGVVAGPTVLVTRASSGIGEAAARTLGCSGAETVLVARSAGHLDELRRRIVEGGGRACCRLDIPEGPDDAGDEP